MDGISRSMFLLNAHSLHLCKTVGGSKQRVSHQTEVADFFDTINRQATSSVEENLYTKTRQSGRMVSATHAKKRLLRRFAGETSDSNMSVLTEFPMVYGPLSSMGSLLIGKKRTKDE